jgi:glycosyltransferase involved in cell wall biosynthesis
MRIVFAGTLPPHPGGSSVFNGSLLAGLARRGHEIAAIAPITPEALARGDPLADAPFAVTRYIVSQFETAPCNPASEEFRRVEGRGVVSNLVPLLETARPDVVIAGRETFAWHVPAVAHRYGVPCVLVSHGALVWGLIDGSYPRELTARLLDCLGEADCIIAVAHHLGQRLRDLGLERIEVIANAVDPAMFAPAPRDPDLMRSLGIGSERVVVAHLSNLKELKRPLDLVHSAVAARRADPRLIYLVVGDGTCRAATEAECARAGVDEHFRFTGWVPHHEVVRYINLADVVVMPSAAEALALVYLETQACGRVLIASDVAGAREVVEDEVTGLLFGVGDIDALTAATLRAAADPALRVAIGTRARAAAAARPLDVALSEYEAVCARTALHAKR